jgi:hypothetical protein
MLHVVLNHHILLLITRRRLSDNALESVLVPLDGLGLVDTVGGADLALASPTLGNALAGAGHAHVEVHAVDTVLRQPCPLCRTIVCGLPNARVVLDAQVDVLADTESEVARLAEVALAEFVFLDLEATLENLLGLGTADGDMDGNPVKSCQPPMPCPWWVV